MKPWGALSGLERCEQLAGAKKMGLAAGVKIMTSVLDTLAYHRHEKETDTIPRRE